MNLPFPFFHSLCDDTGVLEIPRVNDRVQVTATTQMKMMKDLARLALPRRPSTPVTVP